MSKASIVILHVAYWIIYVTIFLAFTIVTASFHGTAPVQSRRLFAVILLMSCAIHYLHYSWLVPQFLAKRKTRHFIWGIISLCSAYATLLIIVQMVKVGRSAEASDSLHGPVVFTWVILWAVYAVVAFVNGMLATLMKGAITWYEEIHIMEVMARNNLQTQLALLRAQINPHFLFNTLNNIDILIARSSIDASRYLNKLSDMLRFMLYETQAEKIPLSAEFEYIRKYIELQTIRTSNSTFVTLNLDEDERDRQVPPLLFIPFIENAFKHSTNKKINNAIKISISAKGDSIEFHCRNIVSRGTVAQKASGLGLDIMRQRLELLYNNTYTLSISQDDLYFDVKLSITYGN